MMKLLIAVLSSTLIACSVTTATPVNPSRTRNLESSSTAIYTATATTYPSTSTFIDLDVNLVDCGRYSRETKEAIKGYAEAKYNVELMREKCESIAAKIITQTTVVENLNERVRLMLSLTTLRDNGPDYMETLSLFRGGNDVLAKLQHQRRICNDQYPVLSKKLRLAKESLAREFLESSASVLDGSSTDSERASTSGTQGSPQPQGPPPSYEVVMRNPKLYKVTQQGPDDQLPSYQDVMRNPQKFPKVLEDPDVTESSSMSPSIVHSTQTSSSVPPSQHTASSTLRRVASTLQRASSSLRRVASSVQKVSSSLAWKVDRS
ncbi:hypothetical protein MT418_004850 [Batrachochytrium dendrobatidis]